MPSLINLFSKGFRGNPWRIFFQKAGYNNEPNTETKKGIKLGFQHPRKNQEKERKICTPPHPQPPYDIA